MISQVWDIIYKVVNQPYNFGDFHFKLIFVFYIGILMTTIKLFIPSIGSIAPKGQGANSKYNSKQNSKAFEKNKDDMRGVERRKWMNF